MPHILSPNTSCILIPNLEAVLQVALCTVSLSMVALSYRNVHLSAHPVTAAFLREVVKETRCNTPTIEEYTATLCGL
jgi:hypothetical protein